jgi:hypothetical protein
MRSQSLERFDFYNKRDPIYFLQRFDLGFVYRIDERMQTCHADPVKGAEPPVWGWVKTGDVAVRCFFSLCRQ